MRAGRSRWCTIARPGSSSRPTRPSWRAAPRTSPRTSTRRRRGDGPVARLRNASRGTPASTHCWGDPMRVADYSPLLLPALRERVEVVVAEPGKRAPAADVALYHVGNDPDAHGWIVDALDERPGVVVLHEYVLH